MYVKRVHIENYGAIDSLNINFPFDGSKPKPIVIVGVNGSGKSLFLSQIVNALISIQVEAYPDSPEVESGKVYKLRSSQYIRSGREYSTARVDFLNSMSALELILKNFKKNSERLPTDLAETDFKRLFEELPQDTQSVFEHKIDQQKARSLLEENCALYFPPNRFEDPAWLNIENLVASAEYMDLKNVVGQSNRQIINCSPLRKNQDWLFDVIYDFRAFEFEETQLPVIKDGTPDREIVNREVWVPAPGSATKLAGAILEVVRTIFNIQSEVKFSIGPRQSRFVSVVDDTKVLVPGLFHLSAGEASLLNLFLSILRDYDLSRSKFSSLEEVRGIVVVDEIDLHLHAAHQFEVLPKLMAMFPRIQFVVTSHSPLFVLGLESVFGNEGFDLYQLPEGERISSEEFSEFAVAYKSFKATQRHSNDVKLAVERAHKPLIFVEGDTDKKYLEAAISKLDLLEMANKLDIRAIGTGGGKDNLDKAWKGLKTLDGILQPVILLYDCDLGMRICAEDWPEISPWLYRRKIEKIDTHPIQKGIENLFDRSTLERARKAKLAFIDVVDAHKVMCRGNSKTIKETWTVNRHEKTNLCNWLCEHGTDEDFKYFQPTLKLLDELLTSRAEADTL